MRLLVSFEMPFFGSPNKYLLIFGSEFKWFNVDILLSCVNF